MENSVPRLHPAVVLRSHFVLVRTLLAAATVAVVVLAVAVAILAAGANEVAGGTSATSAPQHQLDRTGVTRRYDAKPVEETRASASPNE